MIVLFVNRTHLSGSNLFETIELTLQLYVHIVLKVNRVEIEQTLFELNNYGTRIMDIFLFVNFTYLAQIKF